MIHTNFTDCTAGSFGTNCGKNCNSFNCKSGKTMCSNIDGHCLNGCQAGWNGKWCDSGNNLSFEGFCEGYFKLFIQFPAAKLNQYCRLSLINKNTFKNIFKMYDIIIYNR